MAFVGDIALSLDPERYAHLHFMKIDASLSHRMSAERTADVESMADHGEFARAGQGVC